MASWDYLLPLLGITGYLTLLHLGVWVMRPHLRFARWMGLWFLLSAGFVGSRLIQFHATDGALVRHLVHAQYAISLLIVLVGIPVLEELGGVPLPARARRVLLLSTPVLLAGLWLASGDQLRVFSTPFGQRYLGTRPGPVSMLAGAVAFAVLLDVVVRLRRAELLSRRERRVLMATLLASALLALNDVLMFAAGLPSVPLLDLGFLGQGLIFSGILVGRGLRLHASLEVAVRERTAELEARHRELAEALEVAERARAESHERAVALSRSEASARSLIERSADGMVAVRDGHLLFANSRWRALLGHPEEAALVGRPLAEVVHPSDRAQLEHVLSMGGGFAARPQEVLLHRLDGKVIQCELSLASAELDGSPATLLELRDQTERRELQQRLVMADRLASLGVLAAGVAHEINNPLAFVLTNATVLLERLRAGSPGATDAELVEAAADIEVGAERVRRIVADLQLFSRTPRSRGQPVDPRRVIETSLRLAHAELRDRARVVCEPGEVSPVLADEAQLGQVFLNLLINAAHACPEGEPDKHTVVVRTRAATGPAGEETVIEIIDDGAGIPAEVLPRIFDPFFTTKRTGKGTGLGLSICHSIVSSIGGRIEVTSTEGVGTTMTVRLPAAPQPAAGPLPVAPPPAEPVTRRARVLVIDDEPQVAKVFVRALAEHSVDTVTSADRALHLFAAGEPYDVVFCDLMMPVMTGMDLYEQVARTHPAYRDRFIFVTGGAFTDRARQFLESSGAPALFKPFQPGGIRTLVEQAISAAPRQ